MVSSKGKLANESGCELVRFADEIISGGQARSPSTLLAELLSQAKSMASARLLQKEHLDPTLPAAIFDAFTTEKLPWLRDQFDQVFEVVALPRSRLNNHLQCGDCLMRRALGEGNLAHVALLVTGEVFRAEALASCGLRPESWRPGLYAEVIDAGPFPHPLEHKFTRRVGDENGQLSHDSLILRIRHDAQDLLRPPLIVSNTPEGQLLVSSASDAPAAETPTTAGWSAAEAALPYGSPDSVPDLVFVLKPQHHDPFLEHAKTFHQDWGLNVHDVESIEKILEILAQSSAKVKSRIRVVTHAWTELAIPLFEGTPAGHFTSKKELNAVTQGDAALLAFLFPPQVHLDAALWTQLAAGLPANLMTTFGLSAGSVPADPVKAFMERRLEQLAFANLGGPDAATVNAALQVILGNLSTQLQTGGPSASEISSLSTTVQTVSATWSPPLSVTGLTADFVGTIAAALRAFRGNFRSNLKMARTKLKDKWVDIRGCSIGSDTDFLKAAFDFFATVTGVTAPDLFMGFPGVPGFHDEKLGSATELDQAVQNNQSLMPTMTKWAQTLFVDKWVGATSTKDKVDLFYKEFFEADRVLPVYDVQYKPLAQESLTLYRRGTREAMENWIVSLWGSDINKKGSTLRDNWNRHGKLPKVPALAKHLTSGSAADPQVVFVLPDPEYRNHIKSYP